MLLREKRAEVRGGFTLMELLVVVAILVVLAGAAVPLYMKYLDSSKVDRAQIDVRTISAQLEAYNVQHGSFPASLEVLTQPGADGSKPYFEPSAIIDPWGRPYQYDGPEALNTYGKPNVWSHGARPGDANGRISSQGTLTQAH